ncbi:DNA-binding Lrp family transcriptional regulator [Lipingzhangella halophila]|uniref:DNA-binding Lrp family transcriptional regulator n=1 Tax=Lipingzhangella halophila TaxID=1783352 RepID=A0A7W7W1C7_9ACTN|nr:Lrp/AsnC family transcriptional regulator [Lipingzhangella halophila]MBB4929565.1 DNA-binding Lrp family transcriptional regulator [Lipingzhangella halophila]
MDPVDLEILRVLQNDARITNRDLAAAVGIAPSTCLDRVARLRSAGVIQGQVLRVSPEAMGRPVQAFLAIRVQPHRRPLVEPLVEHIRSQPESRALYHLTGPDDFLILVAAASVADLQRLVLDEFTARPEVTRVQTMLIFEEWDAGPLLPPGA